MGYIKTGKKAIYYILFFAVTLLFNGCATLPPATGLVTYNIGGTPYLSLASLCESKGINLEYDSYTKTAVLTKSLHKINLHVGDKLVLVDSRAQYLKYPVDLYQGMVVVPYGFKEEILDSLFREYVIKTPTARATNIRRIIIDAGHGGKDPGAISRTGLREKTVVLDIAKRLTNLLREGGIDVVMTRSGDAFIPLSSRVAITNNASADLFVSIHANSNRVRSLNGFEVYYVSPNVSDNQRALSSINERIPNLNSSCMSNPSYNLKAILWDMVYTHSRAESIELGRAICRTMGRNLDARVIGIKGARFYVLKGANIPAILIEVGFLSNQEEERFLKNSYYRQRLADSIRQGILSYAQDLAYANN